ncbi:MAG: hypothetical protein MR574_03310 [Oscillospiraceae bacterium]|nr:hypothetical protein [Oscillospiraceae bacterium]
MTERELFEAIGHVDDDLILAADAPLKKRRKPPVYWRSFAAVAACACVFLGGVAVWQSDGFRKANMTSEAAAFAADAPEEAAEVAPAPDVPMLSAAAPQADNGDAAAKEGAAKDSAESSIALGLARCVQIDGVRYFESLKVIDFIANRDPDGVISDSVAADVLPDMDGCSNFGAGYSYWVNEDDTVVVEIDGEFVVFEAAP